jgi:nitrite reductase/ring-hydroxylating ferredoxin subunit
MTETHMDTLTASVPSKRHVRPLKYDAEDGLYFQSWYPICLSADVPVGTVRGYEFLGGRVVVFRGENGVPIVSSAYCPHLGADLAVGQVVGNNIRCAFHHWQYDQRGRCVATGMGDPPPVTARTFTFPTTERYGVIWAFNGVEPLWQIPAFERPEEALIHRAYRIEPAYTCEGWVFCCNTLDIQHIRVVHGIQFDPDGFHDSVEWLEHGFNYRLEAGHQGGIPLSWHLGIRGTSFFRQQGMYDGFWFGAITGHSCPKPGEHTVFLTLSVGPEDEAGRGRSAEERLSIAYALLERTVGEDRAILDTLHMAPGTLTRIDTSLARFFDYLRKYPRAHPSADFIR